MTRDATRRWYLVHKWTSIICTGFMLLLAVTSLPLIFHHEIDEATRAPQIIVKADGQASLDRVLADALARAPGTIPLFMTYDDEKPLIYTTVAPRADAPEDQMKFFIHDSRDGSRIVSPPLGEGVMAFLFDLHANLLLGMFGTYLLGAMGVLLIVSLVSGVVVYAPFMRKLAFGTVRKGRSTRLKWLDGHNMVGIVTLGWVTVVGLSGFLITMSVPITAIWQRSELADLVALSSRSSPVPRPLSLDAAAAVARRAAPGTRLSFIAFPGTSYSTQAHLMFAMAGSTPLTQRLVTPALIDAASGRLAAVRPMPWYVQALFLSVPLHFGDYGGLPLKIIWALLDIALIVVLGSGLYLWLGRRRSSLDRRLAELTSGGVAGATP